LKGYYTTDEAARILCVTPVTIINWVKDGKIKCIRTLGGHRRITASEIERVLELMETLGKG
jgi:putative resolvase